MKRLFLTIFLSAFAALSLSAQSVTVSGQVVGEDGMPIEGVTVLVQGTSNGVVTDADGKYSIGKLSSFDVLIFSCLGYREVSEGVEKRSTINVVLKEDVKVLDDAVVIGYGTQKKSDLTGSVGVVSMDEIHTPAVASLDQALQGRISGVDILSGGGEPGAAASIRIRGTRSISAGNDPLIVVDGILDAVESFSDINPDDIKDISVLKDASATAIYGSRGSNGVIIVTTKGDTASKVSVSFSAGAGMSALPRKLDIMNATEFAQFRNDYRLSAGNVTVTTPQVSGSYPFENPASWGEGTDWQDVLTRKAFQQDYKLNVGYGDRRQSVWMSFGYEDRDGIVIGTGMRRYSTLVKFSRQLFKFMKIGARINYAYRHSDNNSVTINGTSNSSAVCMSPLVGKEDVWNRYGDEGGSGGSIFNSPYLIATKATNFVNVKFLNMAPYVELTPFRGFTAKSTFSYSLNDIDAFSYSPASMPLATAQKTGGTAVRTATSKTTMLSETTITYKPRLAGGHSFDIMGGFTGEKRMTDYNYTKGVGYLDDNVGPYNLGGLPDKRNYTVRSDMTELTRLSVLARANYSWMSRYLLTLTVRGDGSSMFAKGHKWGFFPAAAFRWNITNEGWMAGVKANGLTNLALRLSAGRSGNDSVASYVSRQYLTVTTGSWLFGDGQQGVAYPSRVDNDTLSWEKTDSFNAGLDLSLLNDRVVISADAYLTRTSDLLLALQNASQTGFSSRYANIGGTKGWGFELSLSSHNITRRHFNWETTFTFSHNNSVVTDIGAEFDYVATYTKNSQMLYGYKVGYPVNALWGYKCCGVWHNDEERETNKTTRAYVSYQNQNGYRKYADINHDGVLDSNDLVYLGSTDPVLYGGIQNNFRMWNFRLGIYFTYSIGGQMYNISEFNLGSSIANTNKYRYMTDCWHPIRNPDSDIPAPAAKDGYGSDCYVHDASYLRLRNLSLSYVFDMSRRVKWVKSITIGAYIDNVFLLTRYNGYDPDVNSSSTSARRVDTATYPNPRTYMLSFKIKY